MKLNAKELRVSEPNKLDLSKIKRREIYIICDNVLDTYNIGSIFRLADAVAAKCVYLCGGSETPPNSRIAKASVGTDKWVPWQYASTAAEAIEELKGKFSLRSAKGGASSNNKTNSVIAISSETREKQSELDEIASSSPTPRNDRSRLKIIAIEQGRGSVDFRKVEYREPVAFVVGHETEGVSKEALAMADAIVEIPMFGVNKSLNVMVSLAIVLSRVI